MGETETRAVIAAPPERVRISRYGTRNWAVWLDGEMLVVALYKKGARNVARTLVTLIAQAPLPHDPTASHG